jgi:hypothetical protein
LLFGLGFGFMYAPVLYADIAWGLALVALFIVICLIPYLYAMKLYTDSYWKMRHNYIANLIRADAGNRLYEWLNGICKEHKVNGKEVGVCRIDCVQCNKELRESLGIKD